MDSSKFEANSMTVEELESMKQSIESMNHFHQIGCLRILDCNQAPVNENKYGVHVNMTDLSDDVLDLLRRYIAYVETQEASINEMEQQKAAYLQAFFTPGEEDADGEGAVKVEEKLK